MPGSLTAGGPVGNVGPVPMLDPLATFLTRVLAAGNDVTPVEALFAGREDISDDQRERVDEYARRAWENGYVSDSGAGRISVTADGRRWLEELDL